MPVVTVVVAVVISVVVTMVEVMIVSGGLLMTSEFVPPKKLLIVPAVWNTELKYAGYSNTIV